MYGHRILLAAGVCALENVAARRRGETEREHSSTLV